MKLRKIKTHQTDSPKKLTHTHTLRASQGRHKHTRSQYLFIPSSLPPLSTLKREILAVVILKYILTLPLQCEL